MRVSKLFNVALAGLLIAVLATPVSPQTSVPESALLTEVRLLRQAIEALAGAGSRIQLVFGRLQLQERLLFRPPARAIVVLDWLAELRARVP